MSTGKKRGSVFDDEFEVIYEEEIPFKYSFDTKPAKGDTTDKMKVIRNHGGLDDYDNPDDNDDLDNYEDRYSSLYDSGDFGGYDVMDNDDDFGGYDDLDSDDDLGNYDDPDSDGNLDNYGSSNVYNKKKRYGNRDVYDSQDDYDYYSDNPKSRRARRKSSGGAGRLLSPVKKTAKYGTKAIYSTARFIVRAVSALIFAGTLGFLAYEFWRGAAPYGDPQTILKEKNYALAAYAAVAAIVLLFEFIAFLWSLTRLKIREGRKIHREDTGRGMFSFIFLYIASYLIFLLCSFLPESLGSYSILKGTIGALNVFGALHNVLLGLCLAGAVSCFIRRNMN